MYQGDPTGVWFVSRNNCVTQSKTKIFQLQILNFTYIGSLAWNYTSSKIPTDVSYICFKNIA